MIGILELLKERGLDTSCPIRVVRHKDVGRGLNFAALKREELETYQCYQSPDTFNCDYVVSFIGLEPIGGDQHPYRARFFGVYRVKSSMPVTEQPLSPDHPYPHVVGPNDVYYDLEAVSGFEDLTSVVIDWGLAPVSWNQWLIKPGDPPRDKPVIEGLPATESAKNGSEVKVAKKFNEGKIETDKIYSENGPKGEHHSWWLQLVVWHWEKLIIPIIILVVGAAVAAWLGLKL